MARIAREDPVQSNLRWNFFVNLWDISFITLGLSLVSRETVMPALVSQLTDSKIAVGLIPAIFTLGFYLPQLLIANYSERLRYKKPFVAFVGGLGERVPYLLIALTLYWLAESRPTATLLLFYLFLVTAAASAGFATPAWFDMIAKVIPVQRRGIWSGLGHGLGALLGVIGAYFVGRILASFPFPHNFSLLFGLAFVVVMISWCGLILTREPPSTAVKERVPLRHYLRQLPAILRRDGNYRRFLLSRSIVQLGTMAGGFFMVYGIERFGVDGRGVGLLTGVLVAGQAIMNLLWGVVGDRRGHKTVLAGASLAMAVAVLSVWLAPSASWLVLPFFLLGAYIAADAVSGLNIILEFCPPEDRPTYIGLTNTLLAPLVTAAPIVGGWLATVVGYHGLFAVALAVSLVGSSLLALWVREPRRRLAVTQA